MNFKKPAYKLFFQTNFLLPFYGEFLKKIDYLRNITLAQIEKIKPDILFCKTSGFFLKTITRNQAFLQIACRTNR